MMSIIHSVIHFFLTPSHYIPVLLGVLLVQFLRKKNIKLPLLILVSYFIFFTSPIIHFFVTAWEFPSDNKTWTTTHVPFVLGSGGFFYDKETQQYRMGPTVKRFVEGIRLAKKIQSEKILFSSSIPLNNSHLMAENESAAQLAQEMGISKDKIILSPGAFNTVEEAKNLLVISKTLPSYQYILVTDALHMRRAKYIFQKYYGKEVAAYVVNIHQPSYKFQLSNFELWRNYLHEVVGLIGIKTFL